MAILSLKLSEPRIILSGLTPQEPTGGIGDLAEAMRLMSRQPSGDGRKLLFDCRPDWDQSLEAKGAGDLEDGVFRFVATAERKADSPLGWMQYVAAWEDNEAGKKHEHCFEAELHVTPDTFALLVEQVRCNSSVSLSVDVPYEGAIKHGWAPDGSMKIWDTSLDGGLVRLVGYQLVLSPTSDAAKVADSTPVGSNAAELNQRIDRLVGEVVAARRSIESLLDGVFQKLPIALAVVAGVALLSRGCS
ncbi:MAG: hypothetical protein ABR587_11890 [Candidatus Binatia bacterium]